MLDLIQGIMARYIRSADSCLQSRVASATAAYSIGSVQMPFVQTVAGLMPDRAMCSKF